MSSKITPSISKNTRTSRDRRLAAKKLAEDAVKSSALSETVDTEVAHLRVLVVALDGDISQQKLALQQLTLTGATAGQIAAANAALAASIERRKSVNDQLIAAESSSTTVKSNQESIGSIAVAQAAALVTVNAAGTYSGTISPAGAGVANNNASAVREAYFSNRSSFIERIQGPNNQPSAVSSASQLWETSGSSKGMICTSEQVLKAWNSGSNKPQGATGGGNYAFQFQYNPGTVSMSYFTSPNVDVTMMTSGQEMFNLAGVSGSQGSVSFQVIINRIFDMQYYNSAGGWNAGGSPDIYPVKPVKGDYADIYKKGTMYDVEYLLRVLMGTTMNSYLRGENTADMGWLPAIPVELHLGKGLRYLGVVNSLTLNHMIFDHRMVPLFTTLDIAFARLPDYPASGTTATA